MSKRAFAKKANHASEATVRARTAAFPQTATMGRSSLRVAALGDVISADYLVPRAFALLGCQRRGVKTAQNSGQQGGIRPWNFTASLCLARLVANEACCILELPVVFGLLRNPGMTAAEANNCLYYMVRGCAIVNRRAEEDTCCRPPQNRHHRQPGRPLLVPGLAWRLTSSLSPLCACSCWRR